jgi:hypothetical protein
MPFVSPYRFTNMDELLKEKLGQPEVSREGNPKKFIDKTDPRYQESIYSEPDSAPSMDPGNLGMVGQIRGVARPTAQWLRKMMQTEIKARGKAPTEDIDRLQKLYHNSGQDIDWVRDATPGIRIDDAVASRLLRGTWYRGQEAPPQAILEHGRIRSAQRGQRWEGRPDLRNETPGQGNIGEPRGISLSYNPDTAKYFGKEFLESDPISRLTGKASKMQYAAIQTEDPDRAATLLSVQDKLLKRAASIENTGERKKINRMMPLFEGSPEERVLLGYKPEHGKILNEAYTKAAQRMMEIDPQIRKFALQRGGRHFDEAIHAADNAPAVPKVYPEGMSRTKYFNELMTEELKARGYKGLLHSPHRYGEYELRMFDPADVMHIDKRRAVVRKSTDPDYQFHIPWEDKSSVAKLADKKQELQSLHEDATRGRTGAHLYEWYKDIPGEEILGEKYAKPARRLLEKQVERDKKALEGIDLNLEMDMFDDVKPGTGPSKESLNFAKKHNPDTHKANVDATAKTWEVPYNDLSPEDKLGFSGAVEIWNNAKLQTPKIFAQQHPKVKYWLDKFSENEYGASFAAILPGQP